MNPEDAVDLGREALKACITVGGPIVVLGLFVGLAVGVLQAMTQVQDQTVSFVPKFLVMILGIGIALPWLSDKMVDYTKSTFEEPLIRLTNPTGTTGKQPPWERPGYFQFDQEHHDKSNTGKDDQLASPLPAINGSNMPRLSQKYTMPVMKSSATSSMPMFSAPSQAPFEPPTTRIAEKIDSDF